MPKAPTATSLSAAHPRTGPKDATWLLMSMTGGSAIGGVIIRGAGAETAFLAAGGLGLAGAAFGALREAFTERSPTSTREEGDKPA
jgi:hypothetical protein